METLLKQTRVKLSGPEESTKARVKQRVSFKESNKGQNLQFPGQNTEAYDDDSNEIDMATAIATAAFAIHSLEEDEREYQKRMRRDIEKSKAKTENRKVEMPRLPSSSNRIPRLFSNKEITVAGEDSAKRQQEHKFPTATRTEIVSRVDIWEKTRMERIKNRCEKLKSDIFSWENEKKMEAKRQMETKKNELERRKASNLQHYQNKVARIEHVAGGARVQVEDKRRNQELEAKETAKKIRSTGKFPVKWFCF